MATDISKKVEKRFLDELTHHLAGWRAKVARDFSKESFKEELNQLSSDPLYPKFHFATADYANVRFIGRMSISIGRRLGEIYDKVPRFLAGARFGLSADEVALVIEGLELDICLRFASLIEDADKKHVLATLGKLFPKESFAKYKGIGIEIRYNFNPNDSSRLRKDVDMANNLADIELFPIYLIFSSISPRDEAIKRLTNAGWRFVVGQDAIDFSAILFGLDLSSILDRPVVKKTIETEVNGMMKDMKTSYSFQQFVANEYKLRS